MKGESHLLRFVLNYRTKANEKTAIVRAKGSLFRLTGEEGGGLNGDESAIVPARSVQSNDFH